MADATTFSVEKVLALGTLLVGALAAAKSDVKKASGEAELAEASRRRNEALNRILARGKELGMSREQIEEEIAIFEESQQEAGGKYVEFERQYSTPRGAVGVVSDRGPSPAQLIELVPPQAAPAPIAPMYVDAPSSGLSDDEEAELIAGLISASHTSAKPHANKTEAERDAAKQLQDAAVGAAEAQMGANNPWANMSRFDQSVLASALAGRPVGTRLAPVRVVLKKNNTAKKMKALEAAGAVKPGKAIEKMGPAAVTQFIRLVQKTGVTTAKVIKETARSNRKADIKAARKRAAEAAHASEIKTHVPTTAFVEVPEHSKPMKKGTASKKTAQHRAPHTIHLTLGAGGRVIKVG